MRILVTYTLLKCNKYLLVATSLSPLHATPYYKAFGTLEKLLVRTMGIFQQADIKDYWQKLSEVWESQLNE